MLVDSCSTSFAFDFGVFLGREPLYWVLFRTSHEKSRASDSCALDSVACPATPPHHCYSSFLIVMRDLKKKNHILPINWGGVDGFLCNSSYCRWCQIVIQSRSSAIDGCVRGILWPRSSVPAICPYLSAALTLSLSVLLSILVESLILLLGLYLFPVIEDYFIEIPFQYLIYLQSIKMTKSRKAKNPNKSGFLSHLKCFSLKISKIYVVTIFDLDQLVTFFKD